jgi:plasmid stabilization system protein ParE
LKERTLSYHPLAAEELAEGAEYYGLESSSLRARFIEAVESSTATIEEFPEIGTLVRGSLRRHSVRGFPYSLIYRLLAREIRILVVAHQARRPFYWRGRR